MTLEYNSIIHHPFYHYTLESFSLWKTKDNTNIFMGFPSGSDVKASVYNAGDPGSIPGLGRSPGEGSGSPLQYSCLENPSTSESEGTSLEQIRFIAK